MKAVCCPERKPPLSAVPTKFKAIQRNKIVSSLAAGVFWRLSVLVTSWCLWRHSKRIVLLLAGSLYIGDVEVTQFLISEIKEARPTRLQTFLIQIFPLSRLAMVMDPGAVSTPCSLSTQPYRHDEKEYRVLYGWRNYQKLVSVINQPLSELNSRFFCLDLLP